MNLKSHYKMIIAIIIVIVLVSSLVIYFYPNNTEYYNNGKSVNNTFVYIKNVGNNNVYKVKIVHGQYLFFAQPDTEYKFYSYRNGSFVQLHVYNDYGKLVDKIFTNNAGDSTNVDISSGDFT